VAERKLPVEVLLKKALTVLAARYCCEPAEMRLDHDPLLRVRAYNPDIRNVAARYTPHAHDPACLEWRPQGAEYDRSHYVKTFVRGDHGQFSDVALANRERRRERKKEARPKAKIPKRVSKPRRVKRPWPKRPFRTIERRPIR